MEDLFSLNSKLKLEEYEFSSDDFELASESSKENFMTKTPPTSYLQDALRRLKENKVAMLALVLLGLLVFLIIFGPYFNSYSPTKIQAKTKDITPNAQFWFGTDNAGRDIFTRVFYAGRTSLIFGLAGALISTVVGLLYGAISGYVGGAVDIVMMRILEILASLPYLLVVIVLQIRLETRNIWTLLLALTITGWTGTARIVRAEVLRIKAQEYVLAAKTLGVSSWKIITKHLIPNAMPILIVGITFDVPGFIFSEAFLSYLGIGLQSPATSWGIMCSEATSTFMYLPHQMFFPSLMIAITMLCFTLLGDGLRDALDPKLRK
ncbi:MAG: ABC transporter permease [Fenollaria timonensis]